MIFYQPLLLSLITALAVVGANENQAMEVVTEIGGEAIFNCSTRTSNRMCSLMAGPATVASDDPGVQTDLRFKIIDEPNCIIQASGLQVDDSTTYICYSSVPQIKLVVGRRPNDPILRHNAAEVENNTDHILVTDSGSDAYITCESSEGVPNPTFEWFVDGYPTTDSVTSDYIISESLSKSTLKFPFNDHDKREKLIACYVIHPLYRGETVFVSARVGEAAKTSWAKLEIDDRRAITEGEVRRLQCTGDGMPGASIFEIQEYDSTSPSGSWKTISNTNNATVDKPGRYRCTARNVHEGSNWDENIFASSIEIEILEVGAKSNEPVKADAGMIVGIVIAVLVVIIIVVAVVAVLHRSKRACFSQNPRRNPHGSAGVENGVKMENETTNPMKEPQRGDNPKDGVTPATNHQ